VVWRAYRWWLPQLGQEWSSDFLYFILIQVHWCAVWKHTVQNHSWFTPPTILSIHIAVNSVLSLLFFRSVSIFSGCPIIDICRDHQDMKLWWIEPIAYHPHTRFRYSKLLTYLSHEYCSFSNISGMDFGGIGYRQILFLLCVKNFLAIKIHVLLGACLHLAGCLFHCISDGMLYMGWKVHIEKLELYDT